MRCRTSETDGKKRKQFANLQILAINDENFNIVIFEKKTDHSDY